MEAGQDPALFWHLTPREIGHIMAGAVRRIEREKLFLDTVAWNTAQLNIPAMHKPDKFPSFDKFRGPQGKRVAANGPAPARKSWRELQAMVITFNAANGGEFRK